MRESSAHLNGAPARAASDVGGSRRSTLRDVHPVVEIRQPDQPPLFVSVRGPLEIGRECRGVLLADPQVSRRHLVIDTADGAVSVADLGSTNGSTIDGVPLRAPTLLGPGQVVRCGETTIRLDAPVPASVAPSGHGKGTVVAGPADEPTRTMVATPQSSGAVPAPPEASAPPAPSAPSDDSIWAPQRPVSVDDEMRRTSIDMVAASAVDDGFDLASLPADQGTLTIVFSDIESSTERNVALGDQAWFEVLAIHNRIVAKRVTEFGGTIIKNQGDGFMLSFPGARRALDCMMAVQRDLTEHSSKHPQRAVRIRIGMHTGEVLADADGDLFGQHVVVAARVANLAAGGEILVSSLTKEIIASRGDVVFEPGREVHLKGIGDAVVYPMDWARHR
jgi:class 3 adenylate cyclase